LAAGVRIAAAILGYPETCDDLWASAIRDCIDNGDAGQAAIVRRGRRIKRPRRAALNYLAGRAGNDRRRGIHIGNILTAEIGIAAAIPRNPDTGEDLRAISVSECAEDINGCQAAVINRSRCIEIPRAAAFHRLICRAEGEYRWRSIGIGNGLAADIGIATAIPGYPHPCDDLRACAIGECAEYADSLQAAVIRGDWHIEAPLRPALDRSICRTISEYGRSCVYDRNRLTAIGREAAAIGHLPRASDIVRAAGGVGYGANDDERHV
jgi:hypothetical protein